MTIKDQALPTLAVDIQRMKTSKGTDYYVRIKYGRRCMHPYMFKERFKAEYEAEHFRWFFGFRPEKPDLMAYDEASHPNDPA